MNKSTRDTHPDERRHIHRRRRLCRLCLGGQAKVECLFTLHLNQLSPSRQSGRDIPYLALSQSRFGSCTWSSEPIIAR